MTSGRGVVCTIIYAFNLAYPSTIGERTDAPKKTTTTSITTSTICITPAITTSIIITIGIITNTTIADIF